MAEPAYSAETNPGVAGRQREALLAIIGDLESEAEQRVSKRQVIEQRWLADLRQYHGVYDEKIQKELEEAKKSRVFISTTRTKTNACEARLSDMLFPTDERNYGVLPTPVPELTLEAEEAARRSAEAMQAAVDNPNDPQAVHAAANAVAATKLINARMEEARQRARAMEEEIDDNLRQCKYSIRAREVIRDGCRIGTGVMKGPVRAEMRRRSWERGENGEYVMSARVREQANDKFAFWRVDPWNFFPNMDARSMEDCDSVFERHLMNAKQLKKLARQPGFDQDAIRRLLKDQPRSALPSYIADLRSITGAYHDVMSDRYHVWEYHGPLDLEQMRLLAMATGKVDVLDDLDDVDPLQEIDLVVWFCQGELLKFGIYPLDSGESVYSVWNLEKDETSVFGFGIPYLMRDSQKSLNAGWRIMLDNAGLASGPQIVINRDAIEPVDGDWNLTPRKVWLRKHTATGDAKPFETHNIDMHQAELANIIELSLRFIDDETAIPVIAQGDQGAHVTQTAHGMNILMNSVNVVFRRMVKNWDDDMTTPNVRRAYDWLMQFSPKEHIKGDYEVDARGTSVLLVREMQSANLLAFLMQFSGHPLLCKCLKQAGLLLLRRLAQTMMVPADEAIKSDDEILQDEAEAAQQPPQPDIEILKIEADLNRTQMEIEGRERIALIERETALIQLAAKLNMDLEKLRAQLTDKQADRDSKERIFAAEAAFEERQAARGQDTKGSGGYIA